MPWKLKPEIRILVGDTSYPLKNKNLSTDIFLEENAVSRMQILADNEDGKNYLRRIRLFDTITVDLRYADEDADWKTVFGGIIEDLSPALTLQQGDTLKLECYGYGRALRNTHCGEDYGVESENPTIDTPSEIISDLVTNRVNKDFDGDATGYALDGATKVKTLNNPSVQHLLGGYRKNIDLLNELLMHNQAYQAGSAGVHWRVDPSKNLWVDTIAAHTVDTDNWPTYWNWNATESTLTQKQDIKHAVLFHSAKNYANKIVLCTDFRKPGYDYWTEGNSANWGKDVGLTLTDDATCIVGSDSLRVEHVGGAAVLDYYWPSTQDLAWDVTKWGSFKSIPYLKFYARRSDALGVWQVTAWTSDVNFHYYDVQTTLAAANTWYHIALPLGPYWASAEESRTFKWTAGVGAVDWTNVNAINFRYQVNAANVFGYVDDLHVTGKLVREAEDTSELAAHNDHQKIIRMDTAVDDSLLASDDSGTAGRLAYAELLRSVVTPIRGTVTIPLAPKILPGQLAPIKYNLQSNGNYRVDDTFRIQQVHHHFGNDDIFTQLMVTNDLVNTFAVGSSEALSSLAKALYVDPEAKSLKTTGIDTLVTRLSKAY